MLSRDEITRDLTEHGRDEGPCRERHFQSIVDSAPDAMVAVDPRGSIVLANQQTEKLFGYDRSELLGRTIEILVPERFHERHVVDRAGYFAQPRARPMGAGLELHARRKDGSEFPVEISLSPIASDAGPIVAVAVRDVSDRKRAEAAILTALREKETLLREMSHRVKNNLQVISSLINLQAQSAPPGVAREAFRETQNRVRSMALLHERLDQSHAVARVVLGEYLPQLVAELFDSYDVSPDVVRLAVALDDLAVAVDVAAPLGLIVTETVSNCLKHAFPHGRRGRVELSARAIREEELDLSVRDDGVGLPAGFDLGKVETLGLRLVRSLAQQLDGDAELQPAEGDGVEARVRLRIPHPPATDR